MIDKIGADGASGETLDTDFVSLLPRQCQPSASRTISEGRLVPSLRLRGDGGMLSEQQKPEGSLRRRDRQLSERVERFGQEIRRRSSAGFFYQKGLEDAPAEVCCARHDQERIMARSVVGTRDDIGRSTPERGPRPRAPLLRDS